MDNKQQSIIVILVTLIVLFLSFLSPVLAAILLLGIIIVFAVYKSKSTSKDK